MSDKESRTRAEKMLGRIIGWAFSEEFKRIKFKCSDLTEQFEQTDMFFGGNSLKSKEKLFLKSATAKKYSKNLTKKASPIVKAPEFVT